MMIRNRLEMWNSDRYRMSMDALLDVVLISYVTEDATTSYKK
jgi:hypothetical protein